MFDTDGSIPINQTNKLISRLEDGFSEEAAIGRGDVPRRKSLMGKLEKWRVAASTLERWLSFSFL